jgi:tryptophanyl-tRNA synthetase
MNHSFSLPIYITQIKNGALLRTNTYSTAAAWLACGLDVNKVVLPAVGRATNSRTVLVFELFFLFND